MRIGSAVLRVGFVLGALGLGACGEAAQEGVLRPVVQASPGLRVSVTVAPYGISQDLRRAPWDYAYFGVLRVPAGDCTVTATAYSGSSAVGTASAKVTVTEGQTIPMSLVVQPTSLVDHAPFRMYATTLAGEGSTPNTFVAVDPITGGQQSIGKIGGTPAQRSLARDPVSGFLFGVNQDANPGVVTRIDPATGEASVAASLPAKICSIAFSPAGQLYGLEFPNVLSVIDLAKADRRIVGSIGAGTWIQSLDFRSDGTLSALASYVTQPYPTPDLYSIVIVDPITAVVISTGSLVALDEFTLDDIAFAPDGFMYATNFSWCLIRSDPKTGEQINAGCGQLGPLGGLAVAP